MKKVLFLLLFVVFLTASTAVYAAEKAPLGNSNIAVKLDYIKFTDDNLKDADVDTGLYVGLEGYTTIMQNLYLGLEVGYANPEGDAFFGNTELTLVPIELNLKYSAEAAPSLAFDLGAGISYNYGEFEVSGGGSSDSVDDWMLGGQFFADINYKIDNFFIGINGKYQITEDFKDYEFDLNNWRVGGQIGLMF
ncbi:MAG: hypothetical protein A2Y97_14090 [Nitrospirae bacterium RBG_13_39_12]|nr:MAG: hypothetical protein A2Y97_14090 [Nitrospirae bacterium RBG_13_39_12]